MTARFIVGDTRAVLATLEPASVDLVLSSPPFLALRSYLPAGHPDKAHEIGSEATPGAYIDTLLDVVEACARVLAPHGSMIFELGDTGSTMTGGDFIDGSGQFSNPARLAKAAHANNGQRHGSGWPLDRSLCLIPELFRVSLVYGCNPLTGRQTPRWRARNVIRWCRPNPPVGALGDKFRPATSELVVVCRNRRYFDLDAVRTEHTVADAGPYRKAEAGGRNGGDMRDVATGIRGQLNPAGAPPLDWWKIPTQPYEGAHYATWPEQLCVIPVKAMSPARVCRTCGKPSQRIVEDNPAYRAERDRCIEAGDIREPKAKTHRNTGGVSMGNTAGFTKISNRQIPTAPITVGWTDCHHDNWRPGMCLDPFAGSGTTLQVATGHGRDAIGIDLDHRNAQLALGRVGPLMLTVERHDGQPYWPAPAPEPFDEDAWEEAAIAGGYGGDI